MNTDRGTGRTTQQMREAPKDAVFVVFVDEISYARRLARALRRHDLLVIGAYEIERRLLGSRTPVIVDHALQPKLSQRHRDYINYHNECVKVLQIRGKSGKVIIDDL